MTDTRSESTQPTNYLKPFAHLFSGYWEERLTQFSESMEQESFWLRPFYLLFLLQLAYLHIFTLYNKNKPAALAAVDPKDFVSNDWRKECSLTKNDLRAYANSCKSIKWTYGLICLPMISWLSFTTIMFAAFLPARWRRFWNEDYTLVRMQYRDPRAIRDLALDIRPLLLAWLVAAPPSALILMFSHFVSSTFRALTKKEAVEAVKHHDCLRLTQFPDKEKRSSNIDFFNSPAFTITILLFFICGIPGMIMDWMYAHTAADQVFGYASKDKNFHHIIQQIQFYMTPLGWCVMTLFLRSYFTFGLNFISRENEIEIYDDYIKSLPIKGWFRDVALLRLEHVPFQIAWKDVTSITLIPSSLPAEKLKTVPPILYPVVKVGEIFESISRSLELKSDLIRISDETRALDIRLEDLNKEQKAQLFFAIRKHAPSIHLDAETQEALVGSSVLREPKYTEIWFDVLTGGKVEQSDSIVEGSVLRKGAFKILQRIGTGGQAVAYLAETDQAEKVVLKEFQLVPGESLDVLMESARAFENESKLLSQLEHEQIVQVKDMFYENSRVYLVLEYVDGLTLRQLIEKEGALDESRVRELALQMCEILSYLHSKNPPIVHRDFTPDNLILQSNGILKLIDFSVAQSEKNIKSGECAGKHSYSPPEQFRAEAVPQSDIYALGSTMYYMLMGHDPTPISQSNPSNESKSISSELSRIVSQATNLNLKDRYENVSWLKADLMAHKHQLDTVPQSSSEDTKSESIEITTAEENSESISLKENEELLIPNQ